MLRPIVSIQVGNPSVLDGSIVAASADPRVLRAVREALLIQAEERSAEAEGFEPFAFLEAERAASLRRVLDHLIPDPGAQSDGVPVQREVANGRTP